MWSVCLIIVLCMVLASFWTLPESSDVCYGSKYGRHRPITCGTGGASPAVPTIRGVRLTNRGKEVLRFSKFGLYLQLADATGDRADWLERNKGSVHFYTSGLAGGKGDMIDMTTPPSYATVSRDHYVVLPADTSLVLDLNADVPIVAMRLGAVESTTQPAQLKLLVETSARHIDIADATFSAGFVRGLLTTTAPTSHIGASGIYEYATMPTSFALLQVTSIYNIDPITKARTSGFTPDPLASCLLVAFPGDSLSDVSHLVNQSTPAKTIGTKSGTGVTSERSRFYGSSVTTFMPGRPGAILFGNFGRSLVAPDAELTVEGWFNTYNPSRGSTALFFTRPFTNGALALLVRWSGSFPNCHPPGKLVLTTWGKEGSGSSLTITADAWHHFAMTKSGATYMVYLNGTLVITTNIASVPGGTQFILGGYRSPAWGDASNWDDWDDAQAYFNDFRVYTCVKYKSNFSVN